MDVRSIYWGEEPTVEEFTDKVLASVLELVHEKIKGVMQEASTYQAIRERLVDRFNRLSLKDHLNRRVMLKLNDYTRDGMGLQSVSVETSWWDAKERTMVTGLLSDPSNPNNKETKSPTIGCVAAGLLTREKISTRAFPVAPNVEVLTVESHGGMFISASEIKDPDTIECQRFGHIVRCVPPQNMVLTLPVINDGAADAVDSENSSPLPFADAAYWCEYYQDGSDSAH